MKSWNDRRSGSCCHYRGDGGLCERGLGVVIFSYVAGKCSPSQLQAPASTLLLPDKAAGAFNKRYERGSPLHVFFSPLGEFDASPKTIVSSKINIQLDEP